MTSNPHKLYTIAGPVLHARALLAGTGEPVLWAAFCGKYRAGKHQRGIGAAVSRAAKAAPGRIAEGVKDLVTNPEVSDDFDPPDHVTAYYRRDDSLALEHCGKIIFGYTVTLWILTPNRLHVAARESPSDDAPRPAQTTLYPMKRLADIPRAHIARFSVESKGTISKEHFLQMELVDGSGFEFYFRAARKREQIEHLLALSLGTAG
jgi:hypothetical protein